MALETLLGVKEINGIKIADVTNDDSEYAVKEDEFVAVDHIANVLFFKIQQGPIKEVGVNGTQLTALIEVANHMLKKLNEKFPCIENTRTIQHLDDALLEQSMRTKNREARGVEGLSKV